MVKAGREDKMKEFEKKPTGYLMQNDAVRKVILENPDLPLIFVAWENGCSCICCSVSAYVGEVLDCEQEVKNGYFFIDREEFMDAIDENIYELTGYDDRSEEWYESEVKRIAAEYEPYWKKAIIITVGN